jgi:hypothetical protein
MVIAELQKLPPAVRGPGGLHRIIADAQRSCLRIGPIAVGSSQCPFTKLRTVRLVPNPELAIQKTHDDTVFAETSRCRLLIGCDQLNADSTRGVLRAQSKDRDHEHDTTSERLDRLDRYLAAAVA